MSRASTGELSGGLRESARRATAGVVGLATAVVFAGFGAAWWRVAWRLAFAAWCLAFAARLCETARDDRWVTGRDGVAARVVVTGVLETGALAAGVLGLTVEAGAGFEGRGAAAGVVDFVFGAVLVEDGAGSGAGDTGSGAGLLAAGGVAVPDPGSCACAIAGEKSRHSSIVAAAPVAPSRLTSRRPPRQARCPSGAASLVPNRLAPI